MSGVATATTASPPRHRGGNDSGRRSWGPRTPPAASAFSDGGEYETNVLRGGAGNDVLYAEQIGASGLALGTNTRGGSGDDTIEALGPARGRHYRLAETGPLFWRRQWLRVAPATMCWWRRRPAAAPRSRPSEFATFAWWRRRRRDDGARSGTPAAACSFARCAAAPATTAVAHAWQRIACRQRPTGRIAESRLSMASAGDDRLTAVGGSGNILDGGAGDDEVRGSTGADTFVFDLVAGSADTDRAVLFDGAVDRLQFLGVSDEGAPGLVDDLDAVLRVIVDQPGGDLVLRLRRRPQDRLPGPRHRRDRQHRRPGRRSRRPAHSGQRGPARLKPQMRLPARAPTTWSTARAAQRPARERCRRRRGSFARSPRAPATRRVAARRHHVPRPRASG